MALKLRHLQGATARDGVDRVPAAIARDQDAVVFPRDTAPRCNATSTARRAIELARAFLRFEQEHFIGLDDAVELWRPVQLAPFQEAVTPAKGGVAVHADPAGGFAH